MMRPFEVEPPGSGRTLRFAWVAHWGLALYFQLVSWVPFGRWNQQPCCPTMIERHFAGRLSLESSIGQAAFLMIPVA